MVVGREGFKSPLDRRKFLQNAGVAERNAIAFDAVEADYLRPYDVIKEAQNATKWVSVTMTDFDEQGRPFQYTEPKEVPDWPVRLKAANLQLQLLGLDPKLEPKIGVVVNNGNTELRMYVGEMFANVLTIPRDDEEAKIAALNEARRAERDGSAILLPSTKRETRMKATAIDAYENSRENFVADELKRLVPGE